MKASGSVTLSRTGRRKDTTEDAIFNFVTSTIVVLACVIILYPLYFILIASISDPNMVLSGKVFLFPRDVDFGGYERILNYNQLWVGYKNSFFYSIAGSILSTTITILGAYSLSRPDFSAKKVITIFLLITMFFDGGLIPTYILVKSLGLRNTYMALLLVKSIHVFNIFIAVSYFKSSQITSLYEASLMDGCTHFGYMFKVLLPISRPIIIVMLLFYGVFQWNDFFRAMIYLDRPEFQPLQTVLKNLLASNQVSSAIAEMLDQETLDDMTRAAESMKYGIIIMATVPILMLYILLQKYFTKGITMGSVKG
jgi:ABC-type glycerol-3-phosphate transport system permease component